jgi:Ricin-type beta-trefoil lectin domain
MAKAGAWVLAVPGLAAAGLAAPVLAAPVLAAAVSMVLAPGLSASAAQALTQTPGQAVTSPDGLPVGPVKISPLGHPRLCWMAWGNGSPVTLESCDTTLQGEQWTFTSNGVVMNGNGYCLQNGGSAQPGSPAADSLYLSFSGQCAGSAASQHWTFGGVTGAIENPPGHLCAFVQGGALVPGATITARRCGHAGSPVRWSQGTSDLTLSSARPGAMRAGQPGLRGGTGTDRAFTATVAVSNAAKAMTAYAATVTVRAPAGLTVTKLTGTEALSGWSCLVRELRCRGNLPGDSSGTITIAGTVSTNTASTNTASPTRAANPAGDATARDAIAAHAVVAGTNQVPHARLTATTRVRVYTPTTAGATLASTHGPPSGGIVTFGAIAAVLLVALGTALAFIGRRRHQQPTAPRAEPAAEQ